MSGQPAGRLSGVLFFLFFLDRGDGRLICGYPLGDSAFPVSVTDRPWLPEAGIPLLGDVDAF